ncbi:MAG TPA: hypothetical protein EYP36_03770, partial [Calditrichaeota bacterium]|nr:hypothetical protein [Calditrichota bacterium]
MSTGAGNGYAANVQGFSDADMDIDEAWDVLEQNGGQAGGSIDILVAMLDSGVDLDHPDLSANLYSDGIDFSPDNAANADDNHGHGTCTAGIVAAVGNNGEGVAGISFRSQILPLKFFSKTSSASDV